MKVLEEEIGHDPEFRHDRELPERKRTRVLLGADRVPIGELSFARLDRRQSWMIRPNGFSLFVADPGARHARKETTRQGAIARLVASYELRHHSFEVDGIRMMPFGEIDVPEDVAGGQPEGKPRKPVYAPTSVYIGVEDGRPFEARVAHRAVAAPGYVVGWEGFGHRGSLPVYAMGCANAREAIEVVMRVRSSEPGHPHDRWTGRVFGAIVAFGSLVDLGEPNSIPVGLHQATDDGGVTHVFPVPGETLYRIVPVGGSGFDVVARDGRSLGTVSTRELALGMLGIRQALDEEPSASPAP